MLAISTFAMAAPVHAEPFWSGDWYLTLGGSGISAPVYEGARDRKLFFSPIISLGRGKDARFSSRNDNPSIALFDNGAIRAGIAGKLVRPRDAGDSADLRGLSEVRWGAEVGGFVDVYMTDYLRARGELRQGIRAHDGMVADLSMDAFTDIAPNLRVSAGPRATYATSGYTEAYYGVDAAESAASGLAQYNPDGGFTSYGLGADITWAATEAISVSAFTEYKRLAGPAADSSLVRQRGTENQLMFGVSARYKFGLN